jgi:hypothetical protein
VVVEWVPQWIDHATQHGGPDRQFGQTPRPNDTLPRANGPGTRKKKHTGRVRSKIERHAECARVEKDEFFVGDPFEPGDLCDPISRSSDDATRAE